MNLNNTTILSINHENRFFDAGFRYSSIKRLSIQGLLLDLTNGFGITGIWNEKDAFIESAHDYQPIVLNGYNFGSGKVTNISFNAAQDVRQKEYALEIEIFDSGNLFNFTGEYYNGINIVDFRLLEEFSESFSLEKNQDGGYSQTHNATIQFASGVSDGPISAAKRFAKTLFTGVKFGFLAPYSGFYTGQTRKIYTENYNLITNSCDFEESFGLDSNSGNYSVSREHNIETSALGITTITETSKIIGIIVPAGETAKNAALAELENAFNRCSGIFNEYGPANSYPLKSTPNSQSRGYNIFNGSVDYSITFDNDPRNQGSYIWEYETSLNTDYSIATVSENGTIKGFGTTTDEKFLAAKTGFSTIKPNILTRVQAFYTNIMPLAPSLWLNEQSESFNKQNATITYQHNYSNQSIIGGSSNIKSATISNTNNKPVYLYGRFAIFNYGEILQDGGNSTPGTQSISLNILGEKQASLDDYLSVAKTQLNLLKPVQDDSFITASNYAFSPDQNALDITTEWMYNEVTTKNPFL